MAKKRRKKVLVAIVAAVIIAAGSAFVYVKRDDLDRAVERAALPEPVTYNSTAQRPALPTAAGVSPQPSANPLSTATPRVLGPNPSSTAKAVNLAVPFTAQAPRANWEPPFKEFCEEASVLMAISYLRNEAIPNASVAEQKMLAIQAFENKRFGYYEDTTAEETAIILREFYKEKRVELKLNPSVEDIKKALAAGKVVILPAAGRLLGNPYYTPPGPLYHMLVIKGYTAEGKFITNDPGTRRGADFLYTPAALMNAMHDWRADKQIEQGRKVILIVG